MWLEVLMVAVGGSWPLFPTLVRKIRRPRTFEGQFDTGVPKPSHILAGMVATRILQNPDKIKGDCLVLIGEESRNYLRNRDRRASYDDPRGFTVRASVFYRDTSDTSSTRYCYKELSSSVSVVFYSSIYEFEPADKKIILDAMKKGSRMADEMRKVKKRSETQHKAVDLIETFFRPTPTEQPEQASPTA